MTQRPSTSVSLRSNTTLIDPGDSVLLWSTTRADMLQVVNHLGIGELRTNVVAVTKAATLAGLPLIATASVPEGPNGPLLPEIFDNAPHATYVRARVRSTPGTSRASAAPSRKPAAGRSSSPES